MFKNLKNLSVEDILIFFVLITLPLPEHWNSKALLVLLLVVLFRFYKKFEIQFPPLGWLYIAFFVLSSSSFFWSINQPETLKAIVRLFPLLLFSLAYKQIFKHNISEKVFRYTAIVYLIYGFIWIAMAYFRYQENHLSATFFYHELTAPFNASAIYIALIFGQIYIFLLYRLLFSITKNLKIDYYLTFFLFVFQFLLSSKLFLSLLVFVSILFFLKYLIDNKISKRVVIIGLSLSIISIFLFSLSSFTKDRFTRILNNNKIDQVFSEEYFGPGYTWNGLTLRLFQLRCFIEIEKEPDFNSLFGTGLNASQSVLNQKYAKYDLYRGTNKEGENGGYFYYNFHNQYIQMLVEIGFFGTILILLFLYFFIFFPLKRKNTLLFASALLFIAFAFTESYLLRQKGIVSFVLFPLLALTIFKPIANVTDPKDLSLH